MKEESDNVHRHPRNKTSLFSFLFFTYTIETFSKGRFWNVFNLYEPLDCHKSEILGEKLEYLWDYHMRECKTKEKKPNICTVLFRLFWLDILKDSILLTLSLVPRIMQPLLLGNILCYFGATTSISKSEALCYISLLVFFNFMNTFVSVHFKFSSTITALKIRIACSTCIHRKILKMNRITQNNAINLISNDLSRFDRTANYAYYVWGSPLFLISILNLIYYDVGVSGLAGATWFILYMIFQSFFARWIGRFRNIIAKKTDLRIKLMGEVLSSIKVIKMYAWEKAFSKLVRGSRNVEMRIIKRVSYLKGIVYSLQAFVNVLAIFLSLSTMVMVSEEITAPKVFKLIMYYYSFNYVITLMFPLSVTKATELHQILKRVNDFMILEEAEIPQGKFYEPTDKRVILRDLTTLSHSPSKKSSNSMSRGTDEQSLIENEEKKFSLQNIDLNIDDGLLYGVTGSVGSGKSTLLLTIIGETKRSGYMSINGTVSFSSQEPWFIGGTIRQNILFGQPFEEKRYSEVIRVCGLNTDLNMLPKSDNTLVGDSGICLSGGQKSRINLARAIYRNVDIYLFDDPFSSVDENVSDFLMDQCMLRFLKDKCRILVTHKLKHLKKCDRILVMDSGKLDQHVTFVDLEKKSGSFGKYSEEHISDNIEGLVIERGNIIIENSKKSEEKVEMLKKKKRDGSEFFAYLKSGNNLFIIISVFLVFIFTQVSESSIFLYISYWTHIEERTNLSLNVTLQEQVMIDKRRYMHIFILIALLGFLLFTAILRALFYTTMVMKSSRTLHNEMLDRIIHTKMTFFETVDTGQILTRFSKDLGAVDEILPRTILESCIVVLGIVARLLLIGYVNPYLVILVLALGALFSQFIRIFVYSSKNLKRIEGQLMGPVLDQVKSTIEGLSTIRALKAQEVMRKEYYKCQDRYTSSCYMFSTVTHAFSFAVEFITTIFISFVTISCFLMQENLHLNGSKVGLAITQAMAFTTYLQFCIIQCVQANNQLVSVERIQEYENLPQETSITDEQIEKDWPQYGTINFKNVQVQYVGNSEPVLKDLSFTINAGEKIGIVGRTGGGKSSLIASILRLVDAKGDLTIDSKNIYSIPVNIIRSRISVLPQDPVIFSGTLRFNLDPSEQIDDCLLYNSLEQVGWSTSCSSCNDLNDHILEKGENLSLGQKQLLCLARIILRQNKIILIDEATSNMDIETDNMIQQVIRKQFKNCTVLTIAHRLSTILDYEKIMVIDHGELIEYDRPESLLQNESSEFYRMLHGNDERF